MKVKEGYILRTIAGVNVVIPYGDEMDLNVMLTLNDTGKFLWEQLQTEKTKSQLLEAVLNNYEIDRDEATAYISTFIQKLVEYECLE